MSYVRFNQDGSDVYVFRAEEHYVCANCTTTRTALEMILHLWSHRGWGDIVPEYVFTQLSKDWHKEKESMVCPWWTANAGGVDERGD